MESKREVLNRHITKFLQWGKAEIDPDRLELLEEKFALLFGSSDKAEKILEILGKVGFSIEILTTVICENTGLPEEGVKSHCETFLKILNM